ncbi:hypothetical protein MKZ38_001378 [Zalerion maritima]|uniref:Alpha-1,2-mannosidase n=1 Tax=Zalerion maritima TaxID=339359 RepID=A0AAD5WRI7_9PEZI|nr:hypothetical protein MKZ38_001378 [Zalerion maritima]
MKPTPGEMMIAKRPKTGQRQLAGVPPSTSIDLSPDRGNLTAFAVSIILILMLLVALTSFLSLLDVNIMLSRLNPGRIAGLVFGSSVVAAHPPPSPPHGSLAGSEPSVLDYVDPLIGTLNGGHVFPGATLPYGMAKPVADIDSRGENAAGYVSDYSLVRGFSHMHDSVTERAVRRVNGTASASPGYFSVRLVNGVLAEMTATQHTALYRFGVSHNAEIRQGGMRMVNSPTMLVDLVDLASSRSSGDIEVDPDTGRIMGNGTYNPSFGLGHYKAYFCTDFKGATVRSTGTFIDDKPDVLRKNLTGAGSGYYNPSGSAGAFVQFFQPDDAITARVGLSFVSSAQACRNGEREAPEFDFDSAHRQARQAWADKLSAVEVNAGGASDELQSTFWSGLYRTMLSPQDYTGENPFWDSGEPYYDSFYCIWDSFRAQHPLLTIVDPAEQTRMVRSLVDIYRHEGKLPDCRMAFCKGFTQGGSNADVVLTDALLKNITAGIDWAVAYEAVVSDAEVEPRDWGVEGRGGLESWHNLGYIPYADDDKLGRGSKTRTVSRTVEYAYDDFCIAVMARVLGHDEDHDKYLVRSANWKNVWKADQKDLFRNRDTGHVHSTNFTGFMQPRLANGTWKYQNTRMCSPIYEQHVCYLDTAFDTYEGSPWLYSFFVPQDMRTLIATMGGRESFAQRLNYFHQSGIIYMGNEQSFLPVYQFHYAGRPALSSFWIHQYIPDKFNSSINGIPGNDDCAMGAFTTFAFLGFFPVAGQDVYLITPPLFAQVSIRTPSGNKAVIRNRNHDPEYRRRYIQSATLDGKPYESNWITHRFFLEGGILEFILGDTEGDWGTSEESAPPSSSEYFQPHYLARAPG